MTEARGQSTVSESWGAWDVDAWVATATKLYPEIESVHLVGSRADPKNAHLESDWDLVVCLDDRCYNEFGEPIAAIETRIAFTPDLWFRGLDLYFLRPDRRQVRWGAAVGMWCSSHGGKHARCLYGVRREPGELVPVEPQGAEIGAWLSDEGGENGLSFYGVAPSD